MRVNTTGRARSTAAIALSVAALAACVTTGADPAAAAPPPAGTKWDCSPAYRIEQKLASGTSWRMCWSYEARSGLILHDVTYQPPGEPRPIRVLNTARIAQIHVPYDDGSNEYNDITDYNFGSGLVNLAPAECPGGTIRTIRVPQAFDADHPDVKGLCTTTRSRGHAYRMQSDTPDRAYQAQGTDMLVYTVNKVGWYEYLTEWRFSDDGVIHMNVGATGSLSPYDYDAGDGRGWPIGDGAASYATSHSHNVFWRLDFGLDGSSRTAVEQYDSVVSPPGSGQQGPTATTRRTAVTKELAGDARAMRWWRVVSTAGRNKDGHPRSYEIVPGAGAAYPGRPFTRHDVYFTEYNGCEQYASRNPLDCGAGHGDSVDTWVDGQTLTHPVAWVNVGFHHIARDEDQQPMPVHWQGFAIAPRDVTAMNPLTPPALAGQNGQAEQE
ncbi:MULTISPECIES: copper amine oxidase [unclassified Streptomyces]|uniref:copper amine oxidase n=1 Tax=unclassified Streptomyces TaxID=2593676 RepID=UPI003D74C849